MQAALISILAKLLLISALPPISLSPNYLDYYSDKLQDNTCRRQQLQMRYAVPIAKGKVTAYFGNCSHFTLFDVDERRSAHIRKKSMPLPWHQHGFPPAQLAKEGVSVVIAIGTVYRAQRLSRQRIVLRALLMYSVMILRRLFWIMQKAHCQQAVIYVTIRIKTCSIANLDTCSLLGAFSILTKS